MTLCTNCNVEKPAWSTHRLCPKCRKTAKSVPAVIVKNDVLSINVRGEVVEVKQSRKMVVVGKYGKPIWRVAMAHMLHRQWKADGALVSYKDTIYLKPYKPWTPETIAHTIATENIHLAMYHLGFGKENIQLDNFKLHTWKTEAECLAEMHGLAINQFPALRE